MPLPPEKLSYSELGGTKLEYSAPVDTSTDRSADEVNLAFAATAAMSRTAIKAWVKFSTDVTGSIVTLIDWDAAWKGGTTTPPVISSPESGNYLVTFPATVLDEQGESHSLNLLAVWGSLSSVTTGGAIIGKFIEPRVLTANSIDIWTCDDVSADSALNAVITIFCL